MSDMPNLTGIRGFLARALLGKDLLRELAAVSVRVDDSRGWIGGDQGRNDRDPAEIQKQYEDALKAYRYNPYAKRIIDITTDYVLGDGITLDAPGAIGSFIKLWWDHPKNQMDLRLPDMLDEMGRAGDIFATLHRNPNDGMSYVRLIPKNSIIKIETAPNDWETEIAYYEQRPGTTEPKRWVAADTQEAAGEQAVMVHYAVNRPVGALLGESDLGPIIPWLLRYSRMLEDRVRLNWALRAFLWFVTVPTDRIAEKQQQYKNAPESGSVIVKDGGETWEASAPDLKAGDARHDMQAVRRIIQAGSYPPHWMGEPEDSNLATAQAMNDPAVRHLRRRQRYVVWMLRHLAHTAYRRSYDLGKVRTKPNLDAIEATVPDISRDDNGALATAAKDLATAMTLLQKQGVPGAFSPAFYRYVLEIVSKFAGEPIEDKLLEQMIAEVQVQIKPPPADNPADDPANTEPDTGNDEGANE